MFCLTNESFVFRKDQVSNENTNSKHQQTGYHEVPPPQTLLLGRARAEEARS